ncbi:MAG: hypothetical protein ACXVA9_11215, partial [Bdellovibrionales bacterium]
RHDFYLPNPSIECEYLLVKEEEPDLYLRWLRDAIVSVSGQADAFAAYSPTPEALKAIGLPPILPEGTKLKIEAPASEHAPYWLRVLYGETELAAYPFHVPPLYVWKKMEYPGPTPNLLFDANDEDPKRIAMGSIIGDFSKGRRFISVRRKFENTVTISVGIDVDNENHGAYTEAFLPQLVVRTAEKEEDEALYSRIEVLSAHFRIPPKKAQRPRPSKLN